MMRINVKRDENMKNVILILVVGLLSSCYYSKTIKDGAIPEEITGAIQPRFEQFVEGCREGNPDKALEVASEDWRKQYGNQLMQAIAEHRDYFNLEKYVDVNRFYWTGTTGRQVIFSNGSKTAPGKYDYFFPVEPVGKEVYVSVGYFDLPNTQPSLILIWTKTEGQWLLTYVYGGKWSVGHKGLVDWFEAGSKNFEEGDYVDALLRLALANKFLGSGRLPLIYNNEKEIDRQYREMFLKIAEHYHVPDTIGEISTQPIVRRIIPEMVNDTLCPAVEYASGLQDSVFVAKECEVLHANIGRIYRGLDRNNRKIIYRVLDANGEGIRYSFEKSTRR